MRSKKREVASNSALDPSRAMFAYLGEQLNSVYIVGADENDRILCERLSNCGQANIFEHDSQRLAELFMLLGSLRSIRLWHRFIDSGKDNKIGSFGSVDVTLGAAPEADEASQRLLPQSATPGSLDQFCLGTAIVPELIKITPRQSVMSILEGCAEITSILKPLVMFRLDYHANRDRVEPIRYLSNRDYHFVNIETGEAITEIDASSEISSYILAIPKSVDLSSWNWLKSDG